MKRGIKIIILCIAILLLLIGIKIMLEPIDIPKHEVSKISISCYGWLDGSAEVDKETQVQDAISIINSIKAIKGNDDLFEELGGESPDIIIDCYDKNDNENYSIYFYGNLFVWNDTYYKIIGKDFQYDKIGNLCKKYGVVHDAWDDSVFKGHESDWIISEKKVKSKIAKKQVDF